ncbi:hypothetical protein [Mumia sp. DW29H23]|uniref:hypothetical protein n=1 Tax=Mumia sp. DW29H23 TaxID=3421241 RepID=UPI003D69E985
MAEDATALRARMRTDLVAAMKARQPEVVTALRTAIAAIDNAEAVEVTEAPHATSTAVSEHVAGTQSGAGATEAERRTLSADEVRAVLQVQIDERLAEAQGYEEHGRADAAARLRREADALQSYVGPAS